MTEMERARGMLAVFRGALAVVCLLAIVSCATPDTVDTWLLAVIVLVALAPMIAYAGTPDPGEDLPEGHVCEECGQSVDHRDLVVDVTLEGADYELTQAVADEIERRLGRSWVDPQGGRR